MTEKERGGFKKDLLIAADDGKIYHLSEADYKKEELAEELSGQARELLSQGVIVAAMPQNLPGIGSVCYLVNLASLRTHTSFEPDQD